MEPIEKGGYVRGSAEGVFGGQGVAQGCERWGNRGESRVSALLEAAEFSPVGLRIADDSVVLEDDFRRGWRGGFAGLGGGVFIARREDTGGDGYGEEWTRFCERRDVRNGFWTGVHRAM